MALRNQPYIPLYVNDFTTDEKLIECSAESTGVYIRIMCLMHKSEQYGKILLKQKSKQSDNQIKNFALQIAKCFPYDSEIISRSLTELIDENVLQIEGDFLIQKRMVKDNNISELRASAGKKGGKATQNNTKKDTNFAKANNKAKHKANYEYVNEIENVSKYINKEVIPTLSEFGKYAIENDATLDKNSIKLKYEAWVQNGWKDGNNKKIINWKSKLLQTIPYLKKIESSNVGGSIKVKAL